MQCCTVVEVSVCVCVCGMCRRKWECGQRLCVVLVRDSPCPGGMRGDEHFVFVLSVFAFSL